MDRVIDKDEPLNIEASSLDELDRSTLYPTETVPDPCASDPILMEPHVSRRCDSSERELLKVHFPVD